jgi:hypothetical protein
MLLLEIIAKFGKCGVGVGYSTIVFKKKKDLLKKSKEAQKFKSDRTHMHSDSMVVSRLQIIRNFYRGKEI